MNEAERGAGGAVAEFAADEVGVEVRALFQRDPLLGGNFDFEADERFGFGDGIDAGEFQDEFFAVPPDVLDLKRAIACEDVGERIEAFGAVRQGQGGDLPFDAAGAEEAGDGDGGQGIIPEFPA